MISDDDIQNIIIIAKNKWGNIKTNKLSTSTLKKTLFYIRKIIDYKKILYNGYSYETLVKICGNNICRYPAVGAILEFYNTNTNEANKFITLVQTNIYKIQEIKSIVKSGDLPYVNTTSSECLNLLYDLFKEDLTYHLDSNKIFELIHNIYTTQDNDYVSLKIIVNYMSYFISLKDKDKAINLLELYNNYIQLSSETAAESFAKESLWKKELIEYLKKLNSERLDKTSAYPENALRKILSRNVLLLRYLESYIAKQYNNVPTSIDSLQWFFNNVTIQSLKKAIIYIANNNTNPENDKVKSKHAKHHCNDFIKNTIVFFRDNIPNYLLCKKELPTLSISELLGQVNDLREIPIENVRRHFYETEIEQIMDFVKDDSKYTLLFTILKEVGLRIGAVCTLKTKHFINHKGDYLDNCRKLEKGKKYRTFPVSDNLKNKVKLYLDENLNIKNNQEAYLFSSANNKNKSIHPDSVRNKLIRITECLNIYGQHVHPHAFRHTIVNNLMSQGNKLENVSKYMGHTSIATTEHYYWTTELENIIPMMNIPWLNSCKKFAYPEDIEEKIEIYENNELSTDLLVSVIGVYHSVMDNDQKLIIKERIPNIEEIFNNICEYSMTVSKASINDYI